ncbi:hypothetical protein B0H14DRAFT_2677164 [Mycena olivaceomarginata]|nr:hypothetical protein B0H14DRAFT_2677164 [Mycena olivaceomarginata]
MLLKAPILGLYLALFLLCHVLAHPLHPEMNAALDGGLGGLFGGEDPLAPAEPETDKALPKHPHLPPIPTPALGGLFTTEEHTSKSPSVQATVSTASRSVSTLASGAATTQFSTTTSTSSSASSPSPATPTGATKEAASSPAGDTSKWKFIGIAALGIGVVAGIMLSIVFFDAWWGFLLALVGKKKKDGTEDLVPDWANRDWEFKIASQVGHRYPTLASLESMTKKQDLTGTPLMSPPASHSLVPSRPPSLYLPAVDPHPLEPLFRRPSATNRPVPQDPMFRA